MRTLLLTLSTAALLAAAPSKAEEGGRYRLEPAEHGFVRMDTLTGQMSLCEEKDGQLACRAADDERAAFADQVEGMAKQIDMLEKRVAELEKGVSNNGVMSEEEFDKTMGYMERFFHRFMGVVRDLQKEYGPTEQQPNRT